MEHSQISMQMMSRFFLPLVPYLRVTCNSIYSCSTDSTFGNNFIGKFAAAVLLLFFISFITSIFIQHFKLQEK